METRMCPECSQYTLEYEKQNNRWLCHNRNCLFMEIESRAGNREEGDGKYILVSACWPVTS